MTIVISALTPGGIVMAGEGRVIQPKDQSAFFTDLYGKDKINYEILTDNAEKVHLIANRFGLIYSGPDATSLGWCLQNEINEFDRIVRLNLKSNLSFSVRDAGEIFNGFIKKALPPEVGYGFCWAGYDPRTNKPFQTVFEKGQDVTDACGGVASGWRTDDPRYPNGVYWWGANMLGKVEFIQELFQGGKTINWQMPLRDAIECVEWLLVTGINGLRFFEGQQQLSGGGIDILVITPTWAGFVKNKTLSYLGAGGNNVVGA